MKSPMVSVITLAYNQERTIVNTIEGINAQNVNFEVEHLILDDCSTDNTEGVVDTIMHKVKTNIRYIRNEKNLGPSENAVKALNLCKGKYIAICEGDDYWIDEHKLQKQVDFLEQHPEYGGVSTNNRWFYEKENRYKDSILEEGVVTFETLSKSNQINSQTMLFKKELIKNRDWIKTLKIGDWAIHLLVTSQLPYYRLPDITTVYRVHTGGIHSLLKEEHKLRNRLDVLMAVLKHVELTEERKEMLKVSIKSALKKLIAYHPTDTKTLRKKYFDFGGAIFNKTLLKSYIK
ncbi:glycosyltransferase family 2 protein [Winogradskyella forsetii]|uniref:glycosyltransferase family 2 protein n=2 Tax=Winogradskyella forsetii TaxID=2686077 RepID=UPI0015CAB550|nr:glycosyltransferase [Winogradskyella forsetii]